MEKEEVFQSQAEALRELMHEGQHLTLDDIDTLDACFDVCAERFSDELDVPAAAALYYTYGKAIITACRRQQTQEQITNSLVHSFEKWSENNEFFQGPSVMRTLANLHRSYTRSLK